MRVFGVILSIVCGYVFYAFWWKLIPYAQSVVPVSEYKGLIELVITGGLVYILGIGLSLVTIAGFMTGILFLIKGE